METRPRYDMNDAIRKLLKAGSEPLGETTVEFDLKGDFSDNSLIRELHELLSQRNGFYAFESALFLRPSHREGTPLGITQWNSPNLWKQSYPNIVANTLFFAEDLFGMQFCICGRSVLLFDPETAQTTPIATSVDEWASWILHDHRVRTGWLLGHFWQLRHGALHPGERLLPKVPFVLGGEFAVENLYRIKDIEGMQFRASLAGQLRDCPDGSNVILRLKAEGSDGPGPK